MTNPCKECIVRAACRHECDKLVEHLRFKNCKKHDSYPRDLLRYSNIALGVRIGLVILYDEDKRWRWVTDEQPM